MNKLFECQYGSRLYGTDTPTSDFDAKVVYLPDLDEVLAGKKFTNFKDRFDADGNKVGCNESMPDNGVEVEFVAFQTFATDFVAGQTYALEMAHALYGKGYALLDELVDRFANADVYSMAGFAMKQTFDYVRRGERMNQTKAVLDVLKSLEAGSRLDDYDLQTGERVLDFVSKKTGLPVGTSPNNTNRNMRTLEMNGRSYLETTQVSHLVDLLEKQMKTFGTRTTVAANDKVEWKSLSHAVRVYQQALELLETGKMTFPRKNAAELLLVKQGKVALEEVTAMLRSLDDQLKVAMKESTQRRLTPELKADFGQWLVSTLRVLYGLPLRA